jgi:anti-anti-sigma factor
VLQVTTDGSNSFIRIHGPFTIYEVAEFQQQITEAWPVEGELIMDLAGVSEIDTAGLQLLLALRKSLGAQLTLQQHSNSVIELLDLYQLASLFGDVIVLSEH